MIKSVFLMGAIFSSLLIIQIADAQEFEKAAFQESATVIYDQKIIKISYNNSRV